MAHSKGSFKKSFRGYNADEVDEFVKNAEDERDALKDEIKKLEKKLDRTEMQLEKYMRAEAVSGDIIAGAKAEADGILSDAKNRAAKAIVRAGRQRARIVSDMVAQVEEQKSVYDAARSEVMNFRAELFRMYGEHIKRINAYAEAAGAFDTGTEAEELARLLENKPPRTRENIAAAQLEKKEPAPVPEEKNDPEPEKPQFEIDEEDIGEFGDGGPKGDAVDEFEGTESLDEVFGKSSYDEFDLSEFYGVENVKPAEEPAPEEEPEAAPGSEPETEVSPVHLRSPEDDSNEFWSEGDRQFEDAAAPDVPTTQITIVKPSNTEKKRWKLKRSVAAKDAEKNKND